MPVNSQSAAPSLIRPQLAVTAFDRVSSMVLALVILLTAVVGALLIIFLGSRVFARQKPVPVTLADVGSGAGEGGGDRGGGDLVEPGIDDIPDLFEPQPEETLQAVAMVSNRPALLDDMTLDSELTPAAGRGEGFG